jgi:trehalose-phosphatase
MSEDEKPGRIDAVLFDMDGVITDTARAHAESWKRLFDELLRARAGGAEPEPFDVEADYRKYVDGKPRHDGLRSFLSARGLDLPKGSPDDPEDAETIAGLGRRKQRYFEAWLAENAAEVYPGTLKLIGDLGERGIAAAVFSSSRNAEAVLKSAGALDLFAAKVDGNDLEALGIPGKPDPAMLHEAAARLGVSPGRAAVIEDAISGVEAGARGGFGLVIGVDRGAHGDELARAGADLVVTDLSELRVDESGRIVAKTMQTLPTVWDAEDEIRARLTSVKPAVFLDYDGTLTPIVDDPKKALLAEEMRDAVRGLAERYHVAIISGRGLELLERLIGVDTVFLAGSHGFEIASPEGGADRLERGVELLPVIDDAEEVLRARLAEIDGHEVERKRFSIAVHYRRAAERDAPKIEAIVDEVLAERRELRKGHGKKVLRVGPNIDWDKGHAVRWILERLERDAPSLFPIYVGDDLTDEDAFRALSGRGLTVAVRDGESRRTAADYTLADVGEVERFLTTLAELAPAGAAR